jgi:hypothetical protein
MCTVEQLENLKKVRDEVPSSIAGWEYRTGDKYCAIGYLLKGHISNSTFYRKNDTAIHKWPYGLKKLDELYCISGTEAANMQKKNDQLMYSTERSAAIKRALTRKIDKVAKEVLQ